MADGKPVFVVEELTLGDETKWIVTLIYKATGARYVFRYARGTEKEVEEVRVNLKAHFGKPAGEAMDLAANYWAWGDVVETGVFIQRTTQKGSWYISI